MPSSLFLSFFFTGEPREGVNANHAFFDALEKDWECVSVHPVEPFPSEYCLNCAVALCCAIMLLVIFGCIGEGLGVCECAPRGAVSSEYCLNCAVELCCCSVLCNSVACGLRVFSAFLSRIRDGLCRH